MLKTTFAVISGLICSTFAVAEMVASEVSYKMDGKTFVGTLVYDNSVDKKRPGIVMIPNWMGPTDNSLEKARNIAGKDYVVLMADVYSTDVRPTNTEEASAAATYLRQNRPLLRSRTQRAVDELRAAAGAVPVDPNNMAAIGFCFGGGAVLELARSGTSSVDAVVSFHGNLDTPNPADAKNIKAKVLVLHGADDPYVPPEQVQGFEAEMKAAGVDWQLISYGGAVHSFTNPQAKSKGQAEYNEVVAKRSFTAMRALFDETFTGSNVPKPPSGFSVSQ